MFTFPISLLKSRRKRKLIKEHLKERKPTLTNATSTIQLLEKHKALLELELVKVGKHLKKLRELAENGG